MATEIQQLTDERSVNPDNGGGAPQALDFMAGALALLDASNAPADVGAHLDHAMH